MSSFWKSKSIIAVAVITVVTAAGTAFFGGADNAVSSALKTVFSPFQSVVSAAANSVNEFRVFIMEARSYKEENERLVSEIKELKRENRGEEALRAENDRLKNMLNLVESNEDYDMVAAEIISFEPNNWYDTIVINRGTSSGIDVDDAVITPDGVVGKVTEVGYSWARIKSILNTENAMGVRVSRTGDIAVVEGDAVLTTDKKCKMTFIDKGAAVIVGDLLETSGSGGIYPAGLKVGNITSIQQDSTGMLQYAEVEPSADFNNLYEVIVITNYNY